MQVTAVQVGRFTVGGGAPLAFIAGPCVIESRDHLMRMADALSRLCHTLKVALIFKASYDKANRSSVDSFRGPGLEKACEYFAEIRREMDLPVTTDIHLPDQAKPIGEVVDVIQIPAFLCRQTDLLAAAAETGKVVNIKKGQFMSPEEMGNAAGKVIAVGNRGVMLTERGTFFGYNRLVNDLTAIPRMQRFAPVVYDATHSCQQPGGQGTQSGGSREFLETMSAAAIAAGADAIFAEVHDNPAQAKSDSATQMPLDQFEGFVRRCLRVRDAIHG